MAHRYFTSLITNDTATIIGSDAAHIARVLRATLGQTLTLCDGGGQDFEAQITQIAPSEITLRILSSSTSTAEPTLWAEVYIACSKGERMDWAIQKSVELGASQITPFFSDYTIVKPKNEDTKNQRYIRIAAEAAKQSGRGILPKVQLPLSYPQMLRQATKADVSMFFYEGGGAPMRTSLGGAKSVSLITGAEGGFTPAEASAARDAGCLQISLGPRILRCETAPIAALAAIMTLSGNLE